MGQYKMAASLGLEFPEPAAIMLQTVYQPVIFKPVRLSKIVTAFKRLIWTGTVQRVRICRRRSKSLNLLSKYLRSSADMVRRAYAASR